MISAVIFDLDGLLADTEKLHLQAYKETLAAHGIELRDSEYEEHWIRLGKGRREFIRARGLDLDPDVLRKEKAARYTHLVATEAEPMPGAHDLLNTLYGKKALALASSSNSTSVKLAVSVLGIASCFSVILSGDSVERGKPHPDIFLLASQKLGVPPANCVVLEDAEKGVIAARAAGMKCIAVPNRHTKGNDLSKATLVVSGLDQVTLAMIESLDVMFD
jgi:HAD superfamily hydrolase (TIGR01509 family)